jgi:hypothetical protein
MRRKNLNLGLGDTLLDDGGLGGYEYIASGLANSPALKPAGGGGMYMTKGILSTADLGSFPISGLIDVGFCNG